MPQYSKSPRSVTAMVSHDNRSRLPAAPKLGSHEPRNAASTRSLRKLNHVVSLWRTHSLDSRNRSKRRRNPRKLRKAVSFPTALKTCVKEFDPENSVLSVSDASHEFVEENVEETPWYDQEYEEMPWWEYPDLDEDDEITALCKQVVRTTDAVYVDRVEALVWTAAVKLLNVARFVVQQKQQQTPTTTTSASPANKRPSSRGKNHARVEIPTMFVGLPREVQAEKRRYRRSSSGGNSAEKEKKSTAAATPAKQPTKVYSAPAPVVKTAPRVRTIRRIVSNSKKDDDTTPTPAAAWVRSSTNPPTPVVLPINTSTRKTTTKSRIQELKEQQRAMKQEQELLEKKKQERQEANERLAAQQRRLERLRSKNMS